MKGALGSGVRLPGLKNQLRLQRESGCAYRQRGEETADTLHATAAGRALCRAGR